MVINKAQLRGSCVHLRECMPCIQDQVWHKAVVQLTPSPKHHVHTEACGHSDGTGRELKQWEELQGEVFPAPYSGMDLSLSLGMKKPWNRHRGGRHQPGQKALGSLTLYRALWTTMLYGHLLARLVTMMSSLSALLSWPTEGEGRRPVHKPWIAAQKNLDRFSHTLATEVPTFSPTPSLTHSVPAYFIFFIILNTSGVNLFFYF